MIKMIGGSMLMQNREFGGYAYLSRDGETWYRGCRRCGGCGEYSYNQSDGTMCYGCNGSGLGARVGTIEQAEVDGARRLADRNKREAAKEAKRLKIIAERDARILAYAEAEPVAYGFLLPLHEAEVAEQSRFDSAEDFWQNQDSKVFQKGFLRAMIDRIWNDAKFGGSLSPAQTAAVVKIAAQREYDAEHVNPVEEGRQIITGKVLSTKSYETAYGTSYKMLVEDSRGFKVYGSIPSALWNEVEFLGAYRKSAWGETDGVMTKLKGMEVTFTATVEASKDDKSFGFFSRPAKASVVA